MIALIPAKGTSERIPRKNMAPLGGHPLIDWTIAPAIESGVFSEIWVSSEDDEILEHARRKGVKGLRRPPQLSEPDATIADVVGHARVWLEYSQPIYILVPTSPFRRPETIRTAAGVYAMDPSRDLLSVVPSDHPPQWALVSEVWWSERGTETDLVPYEPDAFALPRQAQRPTSRHDGGHWIMGQTPTKRWQGLYVDQIEAVDINTPEDLEYAEWRVQTGRIPCRIKTAR